MAQITRRQFLLGAAGTPLALIIGCAPRGQEEMRRLACIGNTVGGDLIGNAMWEVVTYGIAYATPREIIKVEVGIDVEQWLEAELLKGPSPLVWTQWTALWQASPGDYALSVRATNSQGLTQSGGGAGVLQRAFPDGTNAIHDIAFTVEETV